MKKQHFLILVLLFSLVLTGCPQFSQGPQRPQPVTTASPSPVPTREPVKEPVTEPMEQLVVSFLDVDQGDSIFLEFPGGKTMLIDAGERYESDEVLSYIKRRGHKKLDYVLCTHPHADHIGGMSDVINRLEIGEIFMPKASHNTKTFERLLTAIQTKGLSITTAKAGVDIEPEPGVFLEFLAPVSASYQDLNNYSAVLRLSYGNHSFLFTGDAESQVEQQILGSGKEISAQVLKVGHHGSDTSSTAAFLDAVQPQYAVISCGEDNRYGHPHRETLEKLRARNIKVYRTDEDDTIRAITDGVNLTFRTED